MTLKKKLILGFSIPIISLFIITVIVSTSVNSLINANHWVSHTHKVIAEGKAILASMVDMETGMRGFLVGGKDEFLEPYNSGQAYFDDAIRRLKNTVIDNNAQVKRLGEIQQMKASWIKDAAEPQIQMRREVALGEGAAKTFKQVSSRIVGKEKFDALRAALADIEKALIRENDLKAEFLLHQILTDMINKETGQRGFLLSGQEASLAPYTEGKKAFDLHVNALVSHLEASAYPTVEITASLNKAVSLAGEWVTLAAEPEIEARRAMNAVTVSLDDLTALIAQGAGKQHMDAILVAINQFVAVEEKLIISRTEEAESLALMTNVVVMLGAVISAVITAVVGFFIITNVQRLVGREPSELAELSRRIADGDLTMQLSGAGQASGIYAAMIDMVASLKSLLVDISSSSESQAQSTERLSAVATQTSQNVNAQNAATDQVAAAMEELHATAAEVASSTGTVADSANQARDLVEMGNSKAVDVSVQIQSLANNLNDTTNVIEELSERTGNISNILGVIKNIADQTNLLALNAAIEAARAGEQGRGFAVVADEVRALAKNTQDSTQEIETMIQQVQFSASETVSSMSVSKEQTEVIVEQSQSVTDVLSDIQSAVENITEMTNHIAVAAKEQQQTSDEINRNVIDIRELSSQTGEGTSEINMSTKALTSLTHKLNAELGKYRI